MVGHLPLADPLMDAQRPVAVADRLLEVAGRTGGDPQGHMGIGQPQKAFGVGRGPKGFLQISDGFLRLAQPVGGVGQVGQQPSP